MSKFIDQIKKLELEKERRFTRDKQITPALPPQPQAARENQPADSQEARLHRKQDTPPPDSEPVISKAPDTKTVNSPSAKLNKQHLTISSCLFILLLLLSGAYYKLFIVQKNASQKMEAILTDLEQIKKTISDSQDGMRGISASTQKLSSEIEKVGAAASSLSLKIEKLENSKDAHDTAVENLIKAKNTLFNKLGSLEEELSALKSKNNKKGQ